MSNKEEELKMDQTKTGDKSETEGPPPLRQPVFIRRAKGMPLAEFKKVCIERFKKAGLIKPEPQEESNSLGILIHTVSGQTPSILGGDGSSAEQAVVINATSTTVGVHEEYAYGRACVWQKGCGLYILI